MSDTRAQAEGAGSHDPAPARVEHKVEISTSKAWNPTVDGNVQTLYLALCSCGWRARYRAISRDGAMYDFRKHVRDVGA